MTAKEGHDIELWCPGHVVGLGIAWWKKQASGNDRIVFDGAVQPDFEDHMFFDDTTGILTIHEADLNDNGVYWCQVGFDDASEIHLTVLGKYKSQM